MLCNNGLAQSWVFCSVNNHSIGNRISLLIRYYHSRLRSRTLKSNLQCSQITCDIFNWFEFFVVDGVLPVWINYFFVFLLLLTFTWNDQALKRYSSNKCKEYCIYLNIVNVRSKNINFNSITILCYNGHIYKKIFTKWNLWLSQLEVLVYQSSPFFYY